MRYILFLASASIALAQSPRVDLSWTAAQGNPVGTAYNVYRASGACAASNLTFSKVNSAPVGVLSYADTSVVRGSSYCYRVTATFNGAESVPSSTAEGAIPLAPPTGLTITVNVAVNVNVNGQEIASKEVTVVAGQE